MILIIRIEVYHYVEYEEAYSEVVLGSEKPDEVIMTIYTYIYIYIYIYIYTHYIYIYTCL